MELFCKEYSKRDVSDKAYSDVAEILEEPVEAVEVKINGLPAQLGQEINKETKTKSEQSSDKQYHDVFGPFLQPVMNLIEQTIIK